jgi:quercetin dioxygenase-like cupin family protein
MRQVEATRLGRVIITKLPKGKTITPHVDGGAPATYYERYQVALQCLPGNKFIIGDEAVSFKSGEVWHIDNKVEHSVINNSADDRIVCIIDLRCD